MSDLDMHRVKNVHFIGVGGCGMSGIAKVLVEMGYKVTGSDLKEGTNTIRLKDLGVKIYIGHKAPHVRDADLIVYSSAIPDNNAELKQARTKGIKVIKRAEMLSWIINQSQAKIAVAGTHGKTTISAMLAKVFETAKLNPTYFIGCDMDYLESNAKLGNGHFSITEADESDSSFLFLQPTVGIITNIEGDHLEHFGCLNSLVKVFEQFAENISSKGFLVVDAADHNIQALMQKVNRRYITYSLSGPADFSVRDVTYNAFSSSFVLMHKGQSLGKVELAVPGWQNVLNSLAVFAVAFEFGLGFGNVAAALSTFVGARRRFQTVGQYNNILIIDDYAHHPTEIKATLSAAKLGWPQRRIIAAFQPHRYSRTMLLKEQFAAAFTDADKVYLTDIYAASEKPVPGISGKTIVDLIKNQDVKYVKRKEQLAEKLAAEIKSEDIVLTLGAGDIYTVGKEILARLKMRREENQRKEDAQEYGKENEIQV